MSSIYCASTDESAAQFLPSRGSSRAAGIDLFQKEDTLVAPQETVKIDYKVTFRFPPGVYGQLHLRSSASVLGLSLLGGVIGELDLQKSPRKLIVPFVSDADYSGTVIAVIRNQDSSLPLTLERGRSYVQLVPTSYFSGHLEVVEAADALPASPDDDALRGDSDDFNLVAEAFPGAPDLLSYILENEDSSWVRGSGNFGSTDAKRRRDGSP